jgi:hypothetical protein
MFWKKPAVWFVETCAVAFLLSFIMMTKFGHDWHQRASVGDVFAFSGAVLFMFFMTGYLLTTVLFRSFWKAQATWSYPVIAVVLFSSHFEILSLGVGGAFDPADRLLVRVAGACLTFSCTYLGSYFLQQPNPARMVAIES